MRILYKSRIIGAALFDLVVTIEASPPGLIIYIPLDRCLVDDAIRFNEPTAR